MIIRQPGGLSLFHFGRLLCSLFTECDESIVVSAGLPQKEFHGHAETTSKPFRIESSWLPGPSD